MLSSTTGEDESGGFWYFAIGAMMNPVSIKARGVTPIESKPGQLLDYEIYFFGKEGFAEAVEEAGKSFHGVLHRLDKKMMDTLDAIEHSYVRKLGQVRLYDTDELVEVNVYSRPNSTKERDSSVDNPPQQRYIEIMVEGCEYYGVKKEYIDFLKNHDQIPRPMPNEFKSFGQVPDDVPSKHKEEILKCNGAQGAPLWITVNSMVLECDADRESEHFKYFQKTSDKFGRALEMFLSHIIYDPKYGMPDNLEGFTREHSAYIEDWFCRYLEGEGFRDLWRVVGRFDQKYKD